MEILAHRGWWTNLSERNSACALRRALSSGFGVETDIRDSGGQLVISHDPPLPSESAPILPVERFLDEYLEHPTRPTLALNIKADGLAAPLKRLLDDRSITSYFVFDMSVPDTLTYLQRGMKVYTRRSEFEAGSSLDERATGLWLDAFESPRVRLSAILAALEDGKCAAIVSPELHGRPHLASWHALRQLLALLQPEWKAKLLLCSDFPHEAQEFFRPGEDRGLPE